MIVRPKWDYCMKELFRNFIILKYFISDILDIPIEKIRSLKLRNTNLWRRYKYQKQGIVDVLLELNDDTKINIELQIRTVKHWDKRQLFYMGKLLTEELSAGEDYKHMKKCITISILDFHLTWDNNYHKKYLLREENGELFSDLVELHILELNKGLTGRRVDEWIRLFNVETEEDLEMLETMTRNPGILEAVKEVRHMSLGKWARARYDEHMKMVRDQNARDAYVRDEGINIGVEQERNRLANLIARMNAEGDEDQVTRLQDPEFVQEMLKKYDL